ncbi:MAG: AAA family ATPase [Lachnospiraceae bacterium]|nr:AAA family ATPase [Lachnospiraceae bacterium]
MYLNKLLLKNFGKFNNKEIVLKPGINVISGEKSKGKSTVKDFIVSMFYGLSGCALNEKNSNLYETYKPQDGSSFSGKAYIKKDDKNFFVERSFAKKSSRANVLELNSGKELKVKNDNLDGLIFDCCRDDYVNGFCINDECEDYSEFFEHDFKNMIVSGTASVEVNKSIAYLKKKRREFDTSAIEENIDIIDSELEDYEDVDSKLKDVRKKISGIEEELAIETARRKREARRLINTQKKDEEKSETDSDEVKNEKPDEKSEDENNKTVFLDPELLKDYKVEKKLTEKIWFIILVGLFVIGVISAVVCILPFDSAVRQIFIICTILFVIVTIVEGLYAKGVFDEEVKTPSEEEFRRIIYELERKTETYEEVEIDMSFAKSYLDKREEFADMERKILKDIARRDELREERRVHAEKLASSKKEIHAINLAINTINDLSKDISKSYSFMINNNISEIVSKLTDKKYNDLYINEENKPMAMSQNGYVEIDSLDNVDKHRVYLAIKYSLAKSLSEKKMPILFDGIFDGLDNDSLGNMVDITKKINTDQMIIFSSDYKLINKLKEKNIEYNYIELN